MSSCGFEIGTLNDSHRLDRFESGYDGELDRWLRLHARANHQANVSCVWVMTRPSAPEDVCGYFTLSSFQVQRGVMPKMARKGLPNGLEALPAHLLGRFAVSTDLQGRGAAAVMMGFVFERYCEVSRLSASRFLVLHARNRELADYYRRYGFVETSTIRGGSVEMYASTETIRAALGVG